MNIALDYSVTVNGKIDPEYTLKKDLGGKITLSKFLIITKDFLIDSTAQVLKEEQAKGFDKKPVVRVDNSYNKSIFNVNPLGKIEITARVNFEKILRDAFVQIYKRSPQVTRNYIKSHVLYYNNKEIATSVDQLNAWLKSTASRNISEGDIFNFINLAPYARKLERLGVTAQRQQSRRIKSKNKKNRKKILAPNGAYQLAYRAIRRKYKNNAAIYFNFIPGNRLGLSSSFSRGSNKRSTGNNTYLYPTIKIIVKGSGIL